MSPVGSVEGRGSAGLGSPMALKTPEQNNKRNKLWLDYLGLRSRARIRGIIDLKMPSFFGENTVIEFGDESTPDDS